MSFIILISLVHCTLYSVQYTLYQRLAYIHILLNSINSLLYHNFDLPDTDSLFPTYIFCKFNIITEYCRNDHKHFK